MIDGKEDYEEIPSELYYTDFQIPAGDLFTLNAINCFKEGDRDTMIIPILNGNSVEVEDVNNCEYEIDDYNKYCVKIYCPKRFEGDSSITLVYKDSESGGNDDPIII